ncbi:hypothetical protein Tco_1491772 [Tanacetum coccineum]
MTSSWLATMVPPVDITVLTTQQEKSLIAENSGPINRREPYLLDMHIVKNTRAGNLIKTSHPQLQLGIRYPNLIN